MSATPKKKNSWISYIAYAGILLVLFFTEVGTTIRGGIQQLILKTGVKNAPAPTVPADAVRTQSATTEPVTPEPTATAPAESEPQVSAGPSNPLTLRGLDGKLLALDELKGKVVFMNQWATWCPPCRAEMPSIEKLYKSADKKKVAFVMLSLDNSAEKARAYIQQNAFTFPVYMPAGPIPQDFATEAIPTTLILDPTGRIVQRMEGMFNYDTDEFRHYLDSLARPTR